MSSSSGQSGGNVAREARVSLRRLARRSLGSFSQPKKSEAELVRRPVCEVM